MPSSSGMFKGACKSGGLGKENPFTWMIFGVNQQPRVANISKTEQLVIS